MILYKYASASSAIRILEEMRLKVVLPNECNDPFEFTPRSRMTITKGYWLHKVHTDPEHFLPVYDKLVSEGFKPSFSEFLRALPETIETRYGEIRKLFRDNLVQNDLSARDEASLFAGILCLSAPNDSIPMWAHYGNEHKGVAVGIRKDDPAFSRGQSGRVRYVKHRCSVDPLLAADTQPWWNQIYRTIFSKNLDWNYEKEFRILFRLGDLVTGKLKDGRKGYFVDVWGSTIDSVIVGCQISPEDAIAIRSLLTSSKRFSHVKKLRALRHPKSFSLQIAPDS